MPGMHIFLLYLGCLALVFLSWHGGRWYRRRTEFPQKKNTEMDKKTVAADAGCSSRPDDCASPMPVGGFQRPKAAATKKGASPPEEKQSV
jgi:hypothetical protein